MGTDDASSLHVFVAGNRVAGNREKDWGALEQTLTEMNAAIRIGSDWPAPDRQSCDVVLIDSESFDTSSLGFCENFIKNKTSFS